jgi:hypothetical protein
MSTELAIQNDLGMSLAEAIGVTSSGGETKSVSLPRVNLIHNGIMGNIEVNGKTVKTEVVPAGSYKITQGEDNVAYSVNNMGGFNLGRPSGYIEDWEAVPEKTKNLIRSIKRKKILFGMLTANDCIDEAGNPVGSITDPVPFVYEVPPSSTKSLDGALGSLTRKNILPIQYTFNLAATEAKMPNGNDYAIMKLNAGDKVDISTEDQDLLKNFMEYIEYQNSYILQQWEEKNQETISEDDASIVAEFVNVEEAD